MTVTNLYRQEQGGETPPDLETPITGKCAEVEETGDLRADVASVMRVQGRYVEAARYEICGMITRSFCPACSYKELRTRVHRCGMRECPDCARIEAKRLFSKIMHEIKKIKPLPGWRWRHLVLTSKRVPNTDIREDYLKVKAGIKKLRTYFRKKQFGGRISAVGGIEFGPKNAMVHAHIVIFSPYLDLEEIKKVAGIGSPWIKEVKNARQIENATLYAVDFTQSKDPVFIANVGIAMKKTRRIFTWGALYGCTSKEKREKTPFTCPCCGEKMRWEYVPDPVSVFPLAGLSPGYA